MSDSRAVQAELFHLPIFTGSQRLRDSQDFMTLPFFASEKTATVFTMEARVDTERDTGFVRLKANEDGIATMWDKRILVYIHTLITQAVNQGQPVSRRVTFAAYDYFRATGKRPGSTDYERFRDALKRLKGTTIESDRTAGEVSALQGVGWIDSYSFERQKTAGREVNGRVTITLSEWLFEMMTATEKSLSVDPGYFKLTSPIEMRIYELCRKFVGHQTVPIRMNLELFHTRVNAGSGRTLDLKYAINRIHERGGVLGYDVQVLPHAKRTPAARVMVEMRKIIGPRALPSRRT